MAAELDALEAQLPVSDILLFRLLAEHTASSPDLEPAPIEAEPEANLEPEQPVQPEPDRQASSADTARCPS